MSTREVRYSLAVEDLVAVARFHIDHPSPGQKRLLRLCIGLWALGALGLIGVVAYHRGGIATPPLVAISLALFGVLPLLFWFRRPLMVFFARRSLLTAENIPGLGPRTLTISSEGIVDAGSPKVPWPAVDRITTTDAHALFFLAATEEPLILPCRAFSGEAAFNEFVQEACRYWDAAEAEATP